MDGNGFDDLTRRFATGRSRRSVLKGLVGGGAALVATRAGVGLAAPAGKRDICHLGDDGLFHLINVSENALPAHEAHGDGTLYLGTDDHCSACGDACTGNDTCGGGEVAGQCGCTATFTAENCDGVTCGDFEDGCGGTVTCGCADGETCGAEGCEAIGPGCADVQLAGYAGNTLAYGVCVDDYLDIYVNNQYVTTATGCMSPISLGPLQTGDEIHVELRDDFPPCTLEPIQLLCGDTGAVLQELNPTGHCSGPVCQNGTDDWPGFGTCYAETFTVSL